MTELEKAARDANIKAVAAAKTAVRAAKAADTAKATADRAVAASKRAQDAAIAAWATVKAAQLLNQKEVHT